MEPTPPFFDLGYFTLLALGFHAVWRAWETRKLHVLLPSPEPASGRAPRGQGLR